MNSLKIEEFVKVVLNIELCLFVKYLMLLYNRKNYLEQFVQNFYTYSEIYVDVQIFFTNLKCLLSVN